LTRKVAVVTGANRGIGLEISRQLASNGAHVVVTARGAAKAATACQKLKDEGLDVAFHQLDVTDPTSIQILRDFVRKTYGAPDILVNNAGVLLDEKSSGVLDLSPDMLQQTLAVNVYGPVMLCRALVPLMKSKGHGRIVNLSSGMGQLSEMGRGASAYRISKAALNALTCTLAAELSGTDILVNSVCPGWVRTDLGGPNATRSVAEGAETAVWLALLPAGGPTGGFFRDKKPIAW
jgi:NAD(P)-dependent dehydrogenase (short-subunit alcohol dehydrogenase family)